MTPGSAPRDTGAPTAGPSGRPAWTPPAAIRASGLIHGAAALGAAAFPGHWPWAAAAVALNHAVLAGAGMVASSSLVGPTLWRLPPAAARRGSIALTFDDGPDPELTPRVLDALGRAGARATFFCVGERVRRHPGLARRALAEGHQLGNHTQRHAWSFPLSGPRGIGREIDAAQSTIADATGVAPEVFRAPFGVRTPWLDPMLARRALLHVSWSARAYDTVAPDPGTVLERLSARLRPGAVLLLHDGRATGGAPRMGAAGAQAALAGLLERIGHLGLRPVTLRAALDDDGRG